MVCPICRTANDGESRSCRHCAAAITPHDTAETLFAPPRDPGPRDSAARLSFAGRFRILEEIGSGSMGAVYKAVDEKIDDVVSLKILKPGLTCDPAAVELFQNEIRLARRISHKNVCRVYDFGEEAGRYFLTMEYVAGEDLKSVLRMTGPLSARSAVGVARQISEGLAEAHRMGIVHRDIKPGNIRIDACGTVRIMDFGIARSVGRVAKKRAGAGPVLPANREARNVVRTTPRPTPASTPIGTAEYMSPEQAAGREIDVRSDIYSLGVVLYEMLTGERPFRGETYYSLAIKHLQEKPRPPRELAPHIPRGLERLVLRCLEKDPDRRYPDADELRSDLARIERGFGSSEIRLRPNPGRLARLYRRIPRKSWIAGVAAGLLVLLIGVSLATTPRSKSGPTASRKMVAVLPFENLGSPEDEYVADGLTDEITSRLSNLPELGVISRTSSMAYKKSPKTVPQIGRELGVDYVLEGSVRWDPRAGRKGPMRVAAQLITVTDDTHIWTQTFDSTTTDIFALQTEIAEQVARKLEVNLLEPARMKLLAPPTKDERAYDLFFQARKAEYEIWSSWNMKDFPSVVAMYEKAVKLDPAFALAYAYLSQVHSRIYFFGIDRSDKRLTLARACADRALALQPDLVEGKLALALYYYWGFLDYDRALGLLTEIRKTRPNLPIELMGYIWRRQGQWKKSTQILEEAFAVNPRYAQLAYEIGLSYQALRQFNRAEEWYDRALAVNPKSLTARLQKAAIAVLADGDTARARRLLKAAPANALTDRMWFLIGMLDRNYAEVLDRLGAMTFDVHEEQHVYFSKALAYAQVYRAMGDSAQTMAYADRARAAIEKAAAGRPDDPRLRAALGLAYAYLGRPTEAVEEGTRAVLLYPVSLDAAQGSIYVLNLARIHTILGDDAKAIEYLRYLLSIPMCEFLWDVLSASSLKLDPEWDSLRPKPSFKEVRERNLF